MFLGGYVKQIAKNTHRGTSLSLYKLSTQISIVSSNVISVNQESTSRLTIYNVGLYLQMSSAKWNESVTMDSFSVKGFKNGS